MLASKQQTANSDSLPRDDWGINIISAIRLFVKYKFLILGIVLTTVLLAVITVNIIPPVFESQATIQVGQVAYLNQQAGQSFQSTPLEDIQSLISRLQQEYRIGDRTINKPLPRIESVRGKGIDNKNPSFLIITAHAHSPEECIKLLVKATNELLQYHKNFFNERIAIEQKERDNLVAAIANIKDSIFRLKKVAYNSNNEAKLFITSIEINKSFSELSSLQNQLLSLNRSLASMSTYETKIITGPTTPDFPVKPRKTPVIMLSGFAGLLIGFFIAFMLSQSSLYSSSVK